MALDKTAWPSITIFTRAGYKSQTLRQPWNWNLNLLPHLSHSSSFQLFALRLIWSFGFASGSLLPHSLQRLGMLRSQRHPRQRRKRKRSSLRRNRFESWFHVFNWAWLKPMVPGFHNHPDQNRFICFPRWLKFSCLGSCPGAPKQLYPLPLWGCFGETRDAEIAWAFQGIGSRTTYPDRGGQGEAQRSLHREGIYWTHVGGDSISSTSLFQPQVQPAPWWKLRASGSRLVHPHEQEQTSSLALDSHIVVQLIWYVGRHVGDDILEVLHHVLDRLWFWELCMGTENLDAKEFLRTIHEIPKATVGTVSDMAKVSKPQASGA